MADNNNWHILHIDDDEDDIFIVKTLLNEFQGRAVQLEGARTYEEGAQKLSANIYDAVLVDYDLGARTGIQLIREFTTQEYPAPLILLTGRGSYSVDVEAMQAGATLYLTKSEISPLLLERSIRYAIERKQIETQLRSANRTLHAISNSNQALLRAVDENSLLVEVCGVVVQDCNYPLVWVGFAENDAAKSVRPVAHFGFDIGYLESMKITWADEPRGRGPTGTAIRTGMPSVCRDLYVDPCFEPWRKEAIQRSYRSSVALPLMHGVQALGALTIYSFQTDAFSEEDVRLLAELSGDLAFGLASIRLRIANAKAQEKLRYIASFPEQNPNPITESDLDGAIYYMNPAAQRLFPNLPIQKNTHPWLDKMQSIITRFEYGLADIHVRDVTVGEKVYQQTITFMPDDEMIRTYGADITDRKRAEDALQRSEERLLNVFLANPVATSITRLEDGRILDVNPSFEKLCGYSRAEVLGKTPLELNLYVNPFERERMVNLVHLQGALRDYTLDIRSKSGQIYRLTASIEIFTIDNEECIITIGHEVEDEKPPKQQLRDSELVYLSIFQHAPVAIALATVPDIALVDVNEAWVNLFGYDRDEAIGVTLEALGIDPNLLEMKSKIADLQEKGNLEKMYATYFTRAGERLALLSNLSLIKVEDQPYLLSTFDVPAKANNRLG